MKSQSKFKHFHSWKCIWKCRLGNGGHFVSASMCYHLIPFPPHGIDPITSVISLRATAKSTVEDFKLPSNDLIRKTYILDDDFMEGYESYVGEILVIEHWTLNICTVVPTEALMQSFDVCSVDSLKELLNKEWSWQDLRYHDAHVKSL